MEVTILQHHSCGGHNTDVFPNGYCDGRKGIVVRNDVDSVTLRIRDDIGNDHQCYFPLEKVRYETDSIL